MLNVLHTYVTFFLCQNLARVTSSYFKGRIELVLNCLATKDYTSSLIVRLAFLQTGWQRIHREQFYPRAPCFNLFN